LVGRNKNITNTRKMERDFTKYRQNVWVKGKKIQNYWPRQVLRVSGGWGSTWRWLSLTYRPPLSPPPPPRRYSWYSYLLQAGDPRDMLLLFWWRGLSALQPWGLIVLWPPNGVPSFISTGAVHQAAWEISVSEGRN
jgi:hypothetical protein